MNSWMETVRRWWPAAAPMKVQSTKAMSPLGYVSVTSPGQAQWTGRNVQAFAREGFAANPVAYRTVSMIADAASSLPWLVYDGESELADHPVLNMLHQPNPSQTGIEFMQTVYGHLQVAGNAYIQAAFVDGEVRELHALRPDRVSMVAGQDGWPVGYDYTVGNKTVRLSADNGDGQAIAQVMHLKMFNPLNAHDGLSPFEPAARAVDIHNSASAWSKALFDNSARPSGALVYAPKSGEANLTDEQFQRLKNELEGNYQGAGNAGRPMVLEGGLDWKQIAHSPRDMNHIETRHAAARDIALAFGVPPMLLGIPGDNTYSNYAEANRSFWRQTVLPLANRVSQSMGGWLLSHDSANLRLTVDADNVDALADERDAAWKRIDEASFLTQDEKRIATGYSPQDDEASS